MSSDSDFTVHKIEAANHDGGPTQAYSVLFNEYQRFAQQHGGAQSNETNMFVTDVVQGLSRDRQLDDVSVAWGQAYVRQTALPLNQQVLEDASHSANSINRAMAGSMLHKFEFYRNQHDDPEGGFIGIGAHERNEITTDDLRTRNETVMGQAQARRILEPFFETADGKYGHTLFSRIDAAPGGKVDGKVGINDLDNYLNDYNNWKRRSSETGVLFNVPQADLARLDREAQQVEKLKANWDSPAIQQLRGVTSRSDGDSGSVDDVEPYLKLSNLAHAAGFQNGDELTGALKMREQLQPRPLPQQESQRVDTRMPIDPYPDKAQQPVHQEGQPVQHHVVRHSKKAEAAPADNVCYLDPEGKLISDTAVKSGEGPYQAAARLLPGASHKDVLDLAHVLGRQFQKEHGAGTSVRTGQQWLTTDNLDDVLKSSATLRARLDKMHE